MIRNAICDALGLALIASGRVRRARERALSGRVISAIYFHKPNKRLFQRCVLWLMKQGYTFVSADDLIDILKGGRPFPRGAVWLSFDDGWRELLTDVLPLVRKHRIPVTLFINSGIVQTDGLFPWLHGRRQHAAPDSSSGTPPRECITVAELKEIAGYPEVTIGSHTVNHAITPCCTDEQIRAEIGDCKHRLESWTGKPVNYFAYPEGRYDGRERRALIEFGYKLAATTENAFVTRQADCYLVPRFCIGDDVPFSEAVSGMVGEWRFVVDPVKELFKRLVAVIA